jgi:carbonic anhydrase/acetyltransferase-like protein (isoleucine patch superfamily)
MPIEPLNEHAPRVAATAWVADDARLIGEVELAELASVWFGAELCGDGAAVRIGRGSNVQDGSVLRAGAGHPVTLGENVTIGHRVTLDGCSIGAGTLIGIQAVIGRGARIGSNCLVGAGAQVAMGAEFPDGSMIIGAPARVARPLSAEQVEGLHRSAAHYVENARRYRAELKRIG